jgi:surface carbohydrate biosynthesis protein
LPDSGSFWSNESSEKEFERIMDYLNSIGDREWAAECRSLVPQIMVFDEGNKRLEELLNELLPSRD